MVSRRIYFAIVAIMFVIFFLFQFSAVTLEMWNDYEKNPYVKDVNELPGKSDTYQAAQSEEAEDRMAVYIGDAEDRMGNMAEAWALYSKRVLKTYATVAAFEKSEAAKLEGSAVPKMVIIDSSRINWEEEASVQSLEAYVNAGMNLVFCGLPDADVLERNASLRQLLGIREVAARTTTVVGMHLYGGFLLGGEKIYKVDHAKDRREKQDLDLTLPWYRLASKTKVYMEGMPEDASGKAEDCPPVIWEKSFEKASVFAVNGMYMEDVSGLGILSAMEAKTRAYTIYPVVNARNLVVANYPEMAAENRDEMMRRYSQSMQHVMRYIIWPTIIEAQYHNSSGLSCMIAPQFDYSDQNEPDQDQLTYYMKRLNEQKAEAGISAINVSDTPVEQKLSADQAFMQAVLPDYQFTSLYAGNADEGTVATALQQDILKNVRTVVTDYDEDSEILGYATETVTGQQTVADGLRYTYKQDFRTRCVETALGYSSLLIDVMRAAYPQDRSDDTWKDITKNMEQDLSNCWESCAAFSGTTVSECDMRIRNFLAADYKEWQKNHTIHLDILGSRGTTWFILRTNNKAIQKVEGGSWKQIEGDAFLIEAEQEHIAITLEPVNGSQYIY